MSVFDNAIQAIQVGVEDFEQGTESRLKSAVRNVYAGVLLLFKHKLKEMSPADSDEVLLKQQVTPVAVGDSVSFIGKGKKTVDVQAIKERFQSLNIEVDWKALDSIGKIRNEIEHYYTQAKHPAITEALSKCFAVASRFAQTELGVDLRNHLSQEAWQQLITIKEFYETERQLCDESLNNFESVSEFAMERVAECTCPDCYSDLIYFKPDGAVCRGCSKSWSHEEIELEIVAQAGSNDNYAVVTEGSDESVIDCPECGEFALVVSESRCVNCDESFDTECNRCGGSIPPSEIDGSGYCGWCSHMMSKDD